ncbi:hypothetical protein GQ457_13G008100 [Hibiscus cannabinus]
MAMTADSSSPRDGLNSTQFRLKNSPSKQPWAQVVAAHHSPPSPVASLPGQSSFSDCSPSQPASSSSSSPPPPPPPGISLAAAEGGSDSNTNIASSSSKKPAWNKPSNGGVVGVDSETEDGWPALSKSGKGPQRSLAGSSSRTLVDGSLSTSQSPVVPQSTQRQGTSNANPNPTPNRSMVNRQKSFKRGGNSSGGNSSGGNSSGGGNNSGGGSSSGGGNGSGVSNVSGVGNVSGGGNVSGVGNVSGGGNVSGVSNVSGVGNVSGGGNGSGSGPPPPPLPLPFTEPQMSPTNVVPTMPYQITRDPRYRGNSWETRPVGGFASQSHNDHRHSSRRGGNYGPRGDGGYNNWGRRDQDRGNYGNTRDGYMQPLRAPPRGFPRPSPHAVHPPFVRPQPECMYLTMEQFMGMPAFAPAQPTMYVPVPDLPVPALLLHQIDYYFSNDNLVKDDFLKSNMDDQGWVAISLIAGFPRIKSLTSNIQLIVDSLRSSTIVEVEDDKVRRRNDWKKWIPYRISTVSGSMSPGGSSSEMLASSFQQITIRKESTHAEDTSGRHPSLSKEQGYEGPCLDKN